MFRFSNVLILKHCYNEETNFVGLHRLDYMLLHLLFDDAVFIQGRHLL